MKKIFIPYLLSYFLVSSPAILVLRWNMTIGKYPAALANSKLMQFESDGTLFYAEATVYAFSILWGIVQTVLSNTNTKFVKDWRGITVSIGGAIGLALSFLVYSYITQEFVQTI